jgi:hypothetical protein
VLCGEHTQRGTEIHPDVTQDGIPDTVAAQPV